MSPLEIGGQLGCRVFLLTFLILKQPIKDIICLLEGCIPNNVDETIVWWGSNVALDACANVAKTGFAV